MKSIFAACAAILLASACHHEDTGAGNVWGRTVEPRLTTTRSWHSCNRKLSPGHVVAESRCAVPPISSSGCNDVVNSAQEADQMLVSRPQCTDAAIAALKNFSRDDAAAMSDLAGAYYVRAQRTDNPADLLQAFDVAQRAVSMKPRPPGAQFNLALILEALSLDRDAIQAWQRAAVAESGPWADEARAHRVALVRKTALDGQQQWAQVRAGIDAALNARDVARVRQLIAEFPATAERHFEEDDLSQWAKAPSPAQLSRVETYAVALSQFFQDRYFRDVAASVVNARDPNRARQAYLRLAEARAEEHALGFSAAASHYEEAARLLRQVNSPLYLLVRIGYAGQNALVTGDYQTARRQLDQVAAEGRQYPSIVARAQLNRINTDPYLNRYEDVFAAYDAAMPFYTRIGDWEDCAAANVRIMAAMSILGLKDRAWRTAFAAMRDASRLPSGKTRTLLFNSTAAAALGLDHPEAALRFQNVIVDEARRQAPGYLVIDLRHLAAIELRLQRYDAAQRHLDEATVQKVEPAFRQAEAQLAEVQGEAALHVDPGRAVDAFTRAIDAASKAEYATLQAMLHAERADAFRRLGRRADEEADRREALKLLHAEEEQMLRGRREGQDDLWNSYFSRFDETYDQLIRQLLDEGNVDDAFRYAERAGAYEPLDLVRRLPTTPRAFRGLATGDIDIGKLSAYLPPGTFLIEYRVLDDRTCAWILGRDLFRVQTLSVSRNTVKRWTEVLQEAVRRKDTPAFEAGLEAPYDGLLRAPLELVHGAPGGAAANIVIVPDRELRGLPFAALRNPDTKRTVIEDHTLSMSGSALLYVFALLRDHDLSRDTSALLIGDPAFDPKSTLAQGLQRLPNARREVADIRAFYPRSEVLLDEDATPQRFLGLAKSNGIVHIAAHAVVNGDAPSQSFLLLHGVLDAGMLMKDLHTDKTRLVVLGACSTAGGLPVGAAGIAPLVRPIIGAGVPGIVGALWDIDDATAAALLVSFHRHYRLGSDAAKALREAQLELLHSSNPGKRSGLSWAAFQVIGYASSPFASMGNITKEKPP